MSKYFSVFKTSLKQESKTVGNSLMQVFGFVIIIYIFNELWSYVYGGKGYGSVINGYTFDQMLWYLIIAEALTFALKGKTVTKTISSDIKSGKLAYQLNKPYNYYTYQVFSLCGNFIWNLVFLLPVAVILGLIFVGGIQGFSILFILPILLTIVLAMLLTGLAYGMIGLLAFWIEESSPFAWILQKFIMIFGLFFPPEFFPVWLQPIITYSPIYAMMSGPAKLIANFSWESFGIVLLSQVVYIVLFMSLGLLVFKRGARKVNINGG